MNLRRYGASEAAGCVAVCAAAALLRSVYRISGGTLAVIFGAVNGSAWEQVKPVGAAYLGYALLELTWLKAPFRRYVVAKCAGLYLLTGGMIGVSALYAAAPPDACTAASVILAQGVSCLLTIRWRRGSEYFAPATLLLMLYYLMFFSFTVFPPRVGIFRDPLTGGYGIRGF